MSEPSPAPQRDGKSQRRLRNYLLDARFQLKYTGYIVLIAVVLSGGLGFVLSRTSDAVVAQSQKAVAQGSKSVDLGDKLVSLGNEVVQESRSVDKVLQNCVEKEDSPELLEATRKDAEKRERTLKARDAELVQQKQELVRQKAELELAARSVVEQQTLTLRVLVATLAALVIAMGIAGILVTHRIVGPVFKMKRQIREVGEGKLAVPSQLRRGDELVDLFDAFRAMVVSLRERRQVEAESLAGALRSLEGKVEPAELAPLRELAVTMREGLSPSKMPEQGASS